MLPFPYLVGGDFRAFRRRHLAVLAGLGLPAPVDRAPIGQRGGLTEKPPTAGN